MYLPHLPWGSVVEVSYVTPLALAVVLGAMLGLERALAGKHAGMRTYALVSLGSSLFVILGTLASYQFATLFPAINPLIIASNVVLGIGFIGAGLAVFRGEHPVELTTAAGLWVAAGVGMACGFRLYWLALASVVLTVLIFSLLAKVEHNLRQRFGKDGE